MVTESGPRAIPDPVLDDVEAAAERIAGHIWPTPVERSAWLSDAAGADVYLKYECWQRTGSFKCRGAFNAVARLSAPERDRGLVTASAGNHGQAVALAAATFGARCTVFVPRTAPAAKKDRIAGSGATVSDDHETYDDAEDAAIEYAALSGSTFVHAFSDFDVVAGQGTVGLEIMRQIPGVRTIITPVGGGGLASGIGIATRHADIGLIGVQSELTRNMHDALAAGRLVDCPVVPTLADGLAGRTDAISVRRLGHFMDRVELVGEHEIAAAIRGLFRHHNVVAEGAGAVGVAAVSDGRIDAGGPIAVVVSGRNIDVDRFGSILASDRQP